MDEWERQLLQLLDIDDETEDAIWNALSTQECTIATDGSAPTGKGSFAWIIADGSGNRIARCHGPSFGHKISSYRSEAYGILSVLRYIKRLSEIRFRSAGSTPGNSGATLKSRLICDNQAVILRIEKLRMFTNIYPNTTLESEYDVIAEILATLKQIDPERTLAFSHIKGHQDAKVPFEKLSRSAQLNCEADKWAEEYLVRYPHMSFITVPLLPTTGCQLHLPTGTITHDYRRALNLAATVPAMRDKLCSRNGWSGQDFESVHWIAHGRALHSLIRHKVTLVKYLNDMIPVGKLANTYDPKYPASCPTCQEPIETRQHLWECQAPPRQDWRKQSGGQMVKLLSKLDTAPPLQQLYLSALDVLMRGTPVESIQVDPSVAEVADAQAQIGWSQILKGRMVKQWGEAQDTYLGKNKTHRNNGDTWTTQVIIGWLTEWLKLWTSRNEDRHGRDRQTRLQAEDRQYLRELELFYEKHNGHVPRRLQYLFDVPLLERLDKRGIRDVRIWMNIWQSVVEGSYKTSLETG
jgi:hypothetical protein